MKDNREKFREKEMNALYIYISAKIRNSNVTFYLLKTK